MAKTKLSLFRGEDYKSRLLNVDKYEWLKDLMEARYKKTLTTNFITGVLDVFNDAVNDFNKSNIGIHNINEPDTVQYFIRPFLEHLIPYLYNTEEFRLPEQNIRLDSVLYDSSNYNANEGVLKSDSNFIILEYKKASIFSKATSNSVYDVAKEHGLLQKQSAKSTTDKHVLKGGQSRQMVQYLDAVKSIGNRNNKNTYGQNTSAGIITNGLSYYFMICNGNDADASNQTWSILYKLDIAELAYNYTINPANITEADTAIGTFLGLIDAFMSNSKRANFFKWYHTQYMNMSSSIVSLTDSRVDYDNYVRTILANRNTSNGILTTYNNYKKTFGV